MIFFSICLLFLGIHAMGRLTESQLPADLIREVAKSGARAEKPFTLQSMARVNKRWLKAMGGLEIARFCLSFPLRLILLPGLGTIGSLSSPRIPGYSYRTNQSAPRALRLQSLPKRQKEPETEHQLKKRGGVTPP